MPRRPVMPFPSSAQSSATTTSSTCGPSLCHVRVLAHTEKHSTMQLKRNAPKQYSERAVSRREMFQLNSQQSLSECPVMLQGCSTCRTCPLWLVAEPAIGRLQYCAHAADALPSPPASAAVAHCTCCASNRLYGFPGQSKEHLVTFCLGLLSSDAEVQSVPSVVLHDQERAGRPRHLQLAMSHHGQTVQCNGIVQLHMRRPHSNAQRGSMARPHHQLTLDHGTASAGAQHCAASGIALPRVEWPSSAESLTAS